MDKSLARVSISEAWNLRKGEYAFLRNQYGERAIVLNKEANGYECFLDSRGIALLSGQEALAAIWELKPSLTLDECLQ